MLGGGMMGDEYRNRAFRVAYDGRDYHGFQRQPDVETIEGVVFRALSELNVCLSDGVPAEYASAGRTDAGVSAIGQTISFSSPEWLKPRVLNSVLPLDVRVWGWVDVPSSFNARYSAGQRTYKYFLHAPCESRDSRVAQVASVLSGAHDFQRFTADNERTNRAVSVQADRDGAFLVLTVRAAGFPRQLVRRVASYLKSVSNGDTGIPSVEAVVDMDRDDIPRIPPAPPEPLLLRDVSYEIDFQVDTEAFESTYRVFTDRWTALASQTRLTRGVVSFFESGID